MGGDRRFAAFTVSRAQPFPFRTLTKSRRDQNLDVILTRLFTPRNFRLKIVKDLSALASDLLSSVTIESSREYLSSEKLIAKKILLRSGDPRGSWYVRRTQIIFFYFIFMHKKFQYTSYLVYV